MYDLNTESGMAAAKTWTANLLASLTDTGAWVVPRSGSLVTVNKTEKQATVTGLFPEPSIVRVLQELGYTVTEVSP